MGRKQEGPRGGGGDDSAGGKRYLENLEAAGKH